MCHAGITRLERWPRESGHLWISPVTLQSFKSEEELQNHTRKVEMVLDGAVAMADKNKQAPVQHKVELHNNRKREDQF